MMQTHASTADCFPSTRSVRQLTDASGTITYAQTYDPYGVTTSTAGPSQTDYGYTGEFTADDMVYLRARQYTPGMGRFLTRDTWGGDANSPLSLNRWNYGDGNPINRTDPTGHVPSCGFTGYFSNASANYVDKYVNLAKTDWMNTYTAAGVAVQCWAQSYDIKQRFEKNNYSGLGPAKITNMEIYTPYGVAVDGADSYGLLCYIVYKRLSLFKYAPCTVCESKKYMNDMYGSGNYKQEEYHDQTEMKWAVEYMRRRIKLSVDACIKKGCTDTDIYIAASMAQMGTSFTKLNVEEIEELPIERRTDGVNINWNAYFDLPNNFVDTGKQLSRFTSVTFLLMGKGWTVPNINWKKVTELSNIRD
jgi:RHS repeat-associated protein